MIKEICLDILRKNFKLHKNLDLQDQFYYQQDNDPKRTAYIVKQ